MMSKMKCFGALAGCVLATGALYATAPASETFESGSSWTGGTVTTSNYNYSVRGSALPLPSEPHTKVLVIEGSAAYTNTTATTLSGAPVVDMMVQTARPDDELGFPSSENQSDIQIAVAVDSTGCFNVYCKNKSDVLGWYPLESGANRDAAGWARVSFLFDYANNVCQIRVDGQPMVTTNGYLTADNSLAGNGSWYKLALATTASSAVSSMKVIGCTAVDDIVMNVDAGYTYPLDAVNVADTSGVPYAWYDQYGLAWAPSAEAPDASGMTVAAKYNSCLSPLDGQTFAIKSVTTTASKAVVGIPATVANASRKVVLDSGADPTFASGTTTQAVSDNATTVEVDLPAAGAVKYFRLRATDK